LKVVVAACCCVAFHIQSFTALKQMEFLFLPFFTIAKSRTIG